MHSKMHNHLPTPDIHLSPFASTKIEPSHNNHSLWEDISDVYEGCQPTKMREWPQFRESVTDAMAEYLSSPSPEVKFALLPDIVKQSGEGSDEASGDLSVRCGADDRNRKLREVSSSISTSRVTLIPSVLAVEPVVASPLPTGEH